MAPAQPKTYTAGSNPVFKFEGAFEVTKHDPPPGRGIYFNCKIRPHHPRLKQLEASGKKPPTHFHPRQWEFFKVVAGSLTVEINGVPRQFTPFDAEFQLPPGPHHCIYGTPGQPDEVVEFWLSTSVTASTAQLDQAFFENWYGYQEDIMLRGVQPDAIQVLSMFDAGDSYLSPPSWMPFRHFIGYWSGIIIGRWIGGMLGYQPFFPEWTTDWESACVKMRSHWAQRKFAVPDAQEKAKARFSGFADRNGNIANGEVVMATGNSVS